MKMQIFVVEDEEDIARSLQGLLLDAGHTPLMVPGVEVALARFQTARPDAVLAGLAAMVHDAATIEDALAVAEERSVARAG